MKYITTTALLLLLCAVASASGTFDPSKGVTINVEELAGPGTTATFHMTAFSWMGNHYFEDSNGRIYGWVNPPGVIQSTAIPLNGGAQNAYTQFTPQTGGGGTFQVTVYNADGSYNSGPTQYAATWSQP